MLWNNEQLRKIQEIANQNLETLFDALEIDVKDNGSYWSGPCPIHIGDCATALYVTNSYFRCFTRNCHIPLRSTIIGFTRGVLYAKEYGPFEGEFAGTTKGKNFREAVNFLIKLFNIDISNIKCDAETEEKRQFIRQQKQPTIKNKKQLLYRDELKDMIKIPSPYFIKRGFSPEILDRYYIGDCYTYGKKFYKRAICPVFDDKGFVIGYSGRAIDEGFSPKWMHCKKLSTSQTFYNMWEAKPYIKESRTAILVEGIGDVLRLESAGIHNSLGLFGHELNPAKIFQLEQLGVLKLICLLDNDDGGNEGRKSIIQKCSRFYNLEFPQINGKDVGDLDINSIKGLNL